MDLRSRTLPERSTANEEHGEGEGIGDGETLHTDQSTGHVPYGDLLEDETVPLQLFEEDRPRGTSSPLQRSHSPDGMMERDTSPGARWTLHSRDDSEDTLPIDLLETGKDASHGRSMPGEPVPLPRWSLPPRVHFGTTTDFEPSLRDYLRQDHVSLRGETPVRPRENIHNRNIDRSDFRQYTGFTLGEPHGQSKKVPRANSSSRDQQSATRTTQPTPKDHGYRDRDRMPQREFDYSRLLPPPRSYNEPLGPVFYGIPRPELSFPEQFLNEPRPYFPSFSGKHDEWDAFWLKFELLARRYHWSAEKQREQLLLCLKDDAMSFAAGLGPETRGDIDLFVQALRDRFTHRTPAETVRASLNNIKKNSKETIQEYASRVRTLMAKAYPDIGSTETFTQMTIHHLLQGLPDQTIAYEVLIKKPRSLTDAVDMITWHECCKETTRKKSGLRQLSSYAKEQLTCLPDINDTNESEVRRINGKKFVTEERLIQFGRDLKATIEKLFRNGKASMDDLDSKDKSEEELMPKRQEENIICYFCLQEGHIAPRCPLRHKNRKPATQKDSPKEKQSENVTGPSPLART